MRQAMLKEMEVIKKGRNSLFISPETPQRFITDELGELVVKAILRGLCGKTTSVTSQGTGTKPSDLHALALNFTEKLGRLPDPKLGDTPYRTLVLQATKRCNLRCRHCFNSLGEGRRGSL